jgi:P-type conjugative transfer protein VirB9
MIPFLMTAAALSMAAQDGTATMFREETGNNRVQHVKYAENKVLQIAAITNQPLYIQFKEGEPLEDVAGGTIAGWDVHKKGSRLYIRALETAARATLIVTSSQHSYVLDLRTVKATPGNFAHMTSKIIFDYGAPPAIAAPSAELAAAAAPKPAPAPAPPPASGFRNANYSMQIVSETADIRPREVYDDGRFTWFKFPSNVEIPAIYRSQPDSREEVLVNSHMEGDYVVMHATAALWNLRLAGSMVGVFNENYNAVALAPENGTTIYGLARENKK